MSQNIFNPKSIAIVGASQNQKKIASVMLNNLIKDGYKGNIFPINPKYEEIKDLKCFPSISDLPESPEMVCIAIPALAVESVIDECIEKKVKSVVIISAGFKETGEAGKNLEENIKNKLKDANIRLLGPNCLGFINNKENINLSFARENPGDGNIAFISQSGAFCAAILDMACKDGVGFSKIISLGNKADIHENEILEEIVKDKSTTAIAIYLEEFKDGKEFVTLAQKSNKAIILIAPGSSKKAQEAISSHTGSLASSYDTVIAAMNKGNIIQADNSKELFNLIKLINNHAIPNGRNIAIVSNAGGPGIIATDAIEKEDLSLSEFSEETKSKLKEKLPEEASINNPIDIIGDALSDRYDTAIRTALEDKSTDAVLAILTPQLVTEIGNTAEKISNIYKETPKPVYACFLGGKDVEAGIKILNKTQTPVFDNIEEGIRLISKISKYKENIENTKYVDCKDFLKKGKYREDIEKVSQNEEVTIASDELAINILKEFEIDIPKEIVTSNLEEATEFASLNFPVVIKATAEDLAHKTDFDGIFLDIRTITELEEKFNILKENIRKRTGDPSPKVLIQEMINGKAEMFVGANREGDSDIYKEDGLGFGHLLAIGQGGIYTEIYKDIKHILVPECDEKFKKILSETNVYKIMDGYRGKPELAKDKVLDLFKKIQSMLITYPEIISMDINPVIVTEDRAVVVDIKLYIKK